MPDRINADADDALLREIRERFDRCIDYWFDARAERKTDMRYVAGDPWDPVDRAKRKAAGRPCLSLDELGQYFNQVINDVRANPKAIKFSPTGQGASEATAEFYANKTREIEYRSKAHQAYIIALENAVQGSYGYVRVNTKYAGERSFDQDIEIVPFPDPDMVYLDPAHQRPNGSDAKFAFVFESMTRDEFRRRWPEASITDFSHDVTVAAPSWFRGDDVIVAEYWVVAAKRRRLLLLAPEQPKLAVVKGALGLTPPAPPPQPVEVFEDELPGKVDKARILRERMVDEPRVRQYITNGVEILERRDWPGKYIPIAACYGKVLYVDLGKGPQRVLLSMTRPGRDPFMAYCFYRTCEIENVGMTTKNPHWAYEGQLSQDQMDAIARSMHEPVAVLLAKPTTEATGQALLPLPQRSMNAPQIEALAIGAEEMRRAIQAAMGVSPLPTTAQRQNQKSGKALEAIEAAGQRGSFHFVDHYQDMIEHVGVLIEDLMDKVYDTARDVGVRLPNEDSQTVRINDPADEKAVSTKGDHLVTVSTGPSFDSEREAASQFADTLAQISPQVFAALGPMIVKLKNLGPVGDEMVEALERLQPPELRAPKEGEEPDPAMLMAQMQQMQAQMEQMGAALQKAQQLIDTETAKQQAQVEKARIDAEAAERRAMIDADATLKAQEMRNAAAIAVAHINAKAKGAQIDMHAAEEAQALDHEAVQADLDREHEVGLAVLKADAAAEQAERQAAERAKWGTVERESDVE